MSRICDGFNFSDNFPSPGLLMRGRPTSLGLAWTRARTESSVRTPTLDTNKYYLLPLTPITTITPPGAPGAGHGVAETVSGVTIHLSLTDMPLTFVTLVTRGDVTVECDTTRGVGTTDGRSIGEWWVRSPASGLRPVAHKALACSATGHHRSRSLAGARQWPGAGGGEEEWTLDSLRRCGECGHCVLVCHSRLLNARLGAGGGHSVTITGISHHLAVYSVSVRSPEYRGILLASRCQVSLSAFLISESDWVIGVRWAEGSGICYHYASCQTGTRSSQIRIPGTAITEEGGLHIQIHENNEENFTTTTCLIRLILAPDVCYIRPRLLVVCSGHLHISDSPPWLGMIPWTVIM